MYKLAYYEGRLICISENIDYIKKYLKKNRSCSIKNITIYEKEKLYGNECDKEIIVSDDRYLTLLDYHLMLKDFDIFMDETWNSFNNIEEMRKYVKGSNRVILNDTTDIYRSIFFSKGGKEYMKLRSNYFKNHYLWDYPINLYLSVIDEINGDYPTM